MTDALMITPVTPRASGNGLAMRAGAFLEGLARSFRVHCLVVPVFGGPGPSDALVGRLAASVTVLPLDASPHAVDDLRTRLSDPAQRARAAAVHPRPALCRTATVAAARAVAEMATDVALVHVHRLYLVPFLDAVLDAAPRRPVLTVDLDDADATAVRELGDEAEAQAYDRLAAVYLPDLDYVFTVSAFDARVTRTTHDLERVAEIPNAVRVPPEERGAPSRADGGTHDLVFVGTMSYPPNVEAARWLCDEVLPHLPGVSVAIVGSDPVPEVRALQHRSQVSVAGSVPDVAPWYERARVAVVPVRSGGGTRIKLLEALAHARPVVSTTFGAAGLDLVTGRDGLLVADDPRRFAEHCRELLDHPELARRLALDGRAVVAQRATVDVVAGRIDELFRGLVPPRPSQVAPIERVAKLGSQLHRNRVAAETCAELATAGVRSVLLKGPSFSAWLYDSPLERSSGDIDLLIDPSDEPAAGRVLDRLGFRTVHGRSEVMLLGHPAVEWVRGDVHLDLHRGRFWGITVPSDRSWTILAGRTERMPLGGHTVEVLDTAGRAFHAAVHAAASGPAAEHPRLDLERALERTPRDVWQDSARLASMLGADAAFLGGLEVTAAGQRLAFELWPDGRPSVDRWSSLDATLRLAGPPRFAAGVARLLATPGFGSKLTIAGRVAVPTPSYLATQIPWARRTPVHTLGAYVVWLGVLARGCLPALAAIRRARAATRARSRSSGETPHG